MTTERIHQEILSKSPTYIQATIRLALALLPRPQANAFLSTWALQRQLHFFLVEKLESSVKAQKALWWIHELENLKKGTPKHPLTKAVQKDALSHLHDQTQFEVTLHNWIELLSTSSNPSWMTWMNQAELSRIALKIAGNSEILIAEIFLGQQPQHQLTEFVLAANEAKFRIEILRDFGFLLRHEILPIPMSELNAHGLLSQDALHWRREEQISGWEIIAKDQASLAKDKAQKSKIWLDHLPAKEKRANGYYWPF